MDSARRVLQMLLHFASGPSTATMDELAAAAGTTTSSAYRYLALLRELALVDETQRGQYVLSARVRALGRAAEASQSLAEAARPILRRIVEETNETATLIQRLGDSAVIVEAASGDQPVRLSYSTGDLFPLHRGAAAKVLLAHMSASKREDYLRRLSGSMSSAELEELAGELDEVRRSRFAESDGAVDRGVWAAAAGVRRGTRVVAAISLAAPQYRMDNRARVGAKALVHQAAEELGRLLS